MPLYAGLCETDVTPPIGVAIRSNGDPPRTASAIHDPLYARAIVLDNGQERAAIVSADLFCLPPEVADALRADIASRIGARREAVLLSCTGTKSGPDLRADRADAAYLDVLVRKLSGVTLQAAGRLEPAYLTYGETSAQIGISVYPEALNPNGSPTHNYAGPVAPLVQAICINGADGKLMALIFSHACKCDTQVLEPDHISAGWPGAAIECLKARFRREAADGGVRDGALPLFLPGCCADVQPIRQGDWETMRTNGQRIADAAHAARWNAHGRQSEDLSVKAVKIELAATQGELTEILEMVCFHLCGIRVIGVPVAMSVQFQLDFAEQSTLPVLSVSHANGFLDRTIMPANSPQLATDSAGRSPDLHGLVRSAETELAMRAAAYEHLECEPSGLALYPASPVR